MAFDPLTEIYLQDVNTNGTLLDIKLDGVTPEDSVLTVKDRKFATTTDISNLSTDTVVSPNDVNNMIDAKTYSDLQIRYENDKSILSLEDNTGAGTDAIKVEYNGVLDVNTIIAYKDLSIDKDLNSSKLNIGNINFNKATGTNNVFMPSTSGLINELLVNNGGGIIEFATIKSLLIKFTGIEYLVRNTSTAISVNSGVEKILPLVDGIKTNKSGLFSYDFINNAIDIGTTGTYKITYGMSIYATNSNIDVSFRIKINTVNDTRIYPLSIGKQNDRYLISFNYVLDLNQGDIVSLYIISSNNTNINIVEGDITIEKLIY